MLLWAWQHWNLNFLVCGSLKYEGITSFHFSLEWSCWQSLCRWSIALTFDLKIVSWLMVLRSSARFHSNHPSTESFSKLILSNWFYSNNTLIFVMSKPLLIIKSLYVVLWVAYNSIKRWMACTYFHCW